MSVTRGVTPKALFHGGDSDDRLSLPSQANDWALEVREMLLIASEERQALRQQVEESFRAHEAMLRNMSRQIAHVGLTLRLDGRLAGKPAKAVEAAGAREGAAGHQEPPQREAEAGPSEASTDAPQRSKDRLKRAGTGSSATLGCSQPRSRVLEDADSPPELDVEGPGEESCKSMKAGTVATSVSGLAALASVQKEMVAFAPQRGSRNSTLMAFKERNTNPSVLDPVYQRWAQLQEPERTGRLADLEERTVMFFLLVIFVNAIWMLWVVNHQVQHPDEDPPGFVKTVELSFLAIYSVELVLRFAVHGCYFFCNKDASWNWFDLVLVIFGIYDVILSDIVESIAWLRTFRIAKAAKVLRIFRVVALFKELHLIWECLFGSVRSLFWSIIMMGLILYVFAIVFVQGVSIFLTANGLTEYGELTEYFGTVERTMLSLFSALSGGDDWIVYFEAITPTGELYALVYLFFVAFSHIALLNILTGIFVENAMKNAEPDRHQKAAQQLREDVLQGDDLRRLVKQFDPACTGRVNAESFFKAMVGTRLDSYLHYIGVNRLEVQTFVKLVGAVDEAGEMSTELFVNGCMRVKGAATNLDMQRVLFEVKLMHRYQSRFLEAIADTIGLDYEPPSMDNLGTESVPTAAIQKVQVN